MFADMTEDEFPNNIIEDFDGAENIPHNVISSRSIRERMEKDKRKRATVINNNNKAQ